LDISGQTYTINVYQKDIELYEDIN